MIMAKPIIYWSGLDNGAAPVNQDDFQYNKEPDTNNTTHIGTKLVGDSTAASVGLDLGAMTNLQEGDDFPILMSHSAIEPITNVQFYFQPTTNVRTGGTGFANEDDADSTGAQKDFEELIAWGDGKILPTDTTAVDNSVYKYGMRLRFWNDVDPVPLSTNVMDALDNSTILTNNGKFGGGFGAVGNSDAGEETWIEPWQDFISNDCAALKLSLSIPDVEQAGIRQSSLVCRLTYVF